MTTTYGTLLDATAANITRVVPHPGGLALQVLTVTQEVLLTPEQLAMLGTLVERQQRHSDSTLWPASTPPLCQHCGLAWAMHGCVGNTQCLVCFGPSGGRLGTIYSPA